jgi:hypothetical protein
MKPTLLRPGDRVNCDGRAMEFVKRTPAQCGRSAINVFRCQAYVGLNGTGDTGLCEMSDHRVSRMVQRAARRVE